LRENCRSRDRRLRKRTRTAARTPRPGHGHPDAPYGGLVARGGREAVLDLPRQHGRVLFGKRRGHADLGMSAASPGDYFFIAPLPLSIVSLPWSMPSLSMAPLSVLSRPMSSFDVMPLSMSFLPMAPLSIFVLSDFSIDMASPVLRSMAA